MSLAYQMVWQWHVMLLASTSIWISSVRRDKRRPAPTEKARGIWNYTAIYMSSVIILHLLHTLWQPLIISTLFSSSIEILPGFSGCSITIQTLILEKVLHKGKLHDTVACWYDFRACYWEAKKGSCLTHLRCFIIRYVMVYSSCIVKWIIPLNWTAASC